MDRTLYTTSVDDIIDSIVEICNCNKDDILSYIYATPPYNIAVYDVDIDSFFKHLRIDTKDRLALFKRIEFDNCIISHLTTRLTKLDKFDVYSLDKVLTEPTDLSIFLHEHGIDFKLNKDHLDAIFNGKIIIWEEIEKKCIHRIVKRLRLSGQYMDNCINGFLINDHFWEDSNVQHINRSPEILQDICNALNRNDILFEWEEKKRRYAVGFKAKVSSLTFDNYSKYKTKRAKIYFIYKNALYYLVQSYHNIWDCRHGNLMLRLNDNTSVLQNNVFGFYDIDSA